MLKQLFSFLFCTILAGVSLATETSAERERLQGFAEHQSRQKRYEKAREKGEIEFLEEKDQWERQKDRALGEYKKNKRDAIMAEDGPEARADAAAKKKTELEYEKSQELYLKQKKQQSLQVKRDKELPTEEEELDLISDRPRYDVRKRIDYGGSSKFAGKGGSSRPSGGLSGRGGGSPSNNSIPPPPDFGDDEMSGDIGDFGDIPPPPPPPILDEGIGDFDDGDFPPPPPPPIFDGDQTDF